MNLKSSVTIFFVSIFIGIVGVFFCEGVMRVIESERVIGSETIIEEIIEEKVKIELPKYFNSFEITMEIIPNEEQDVEYLQKHLPNVLRLIITAPSVKNVTITNIDGSFDGIKYNLIENRKD